MQTKKRAKPVKFGKAVVKKEVDKKEELAEVLPHKVTKRDVDEDNQKDLEIVKELEIVNEDTDNVQKIKQEIEEKIHPKESEEEEPEPVHLTAEEVSDSDEVEQKADEEEKEPPKKSPFGSFTNEYVEKKQGGGNLRFFLVILFVTFFVGLLLIEAIYFFTTNKALYPPDLPLIAKMKPTATPTVIPSPTEKPLDLSAYTIKVLNGSGISGEAAKVETELIDADFIVDSVGNADADDYTKTVVAAKKSVDEAYLKALNEILSKNYEVDSEIASLSESNDVDVIITIGSTSAE